MKKTLLGIAALGLLAAPLTAQAADDSLYLKGSIGLGMAMDTDIDNMPEAAGTAKVTYDSGWLGTLALGYDISGPFRTELEYIWQKNDLDQLSYSNQYGNFREGDLKTQALMLNGFYDIATGSAWTPYFGIGIGWSKLDLSTPGLPLNDNDNVFAWQIMGGLSYELTSNWAADIQYRFFDTADASINGADFDMTSNDILVGLRYSF